MIFNVLHSRTLTRAAVILMSGLATVHSASLTLVVNNLPDEGNTAAGMSVACVGTLNGWNNLAAVAVVTDHTLVYEFPGPVSLTALGADWRDVPAGANAAFQFVVPGTWTPVVKADFLSNEGNFRVALNPVSSNRIEINAGDVPWLVDQSARLSLNGMVEDPVVEIDRRAFAFPGGRWKALVMSYDDGHIQDRGLAPMFSTHGIKGTFHLNSGSLDTWTFLTGNELGNLFSGHEISSHTVNHPYLEQIDNDAIAWQVSQDRAALAAVAGYPIRSMAYPFGTYDKRVLSVLASNGVPCARTIQSTFSLKYLPTHPLKWHPTCHHTAALGMGQYLIDWQTEEMALLFIWGHSYELDNGYSDNSWAYMDQVCRVVGDRGDIWYASMGDVHEYLSAIRSLQHPAQGVVHNPSVTVSVWAKLAGSLAKVRPGATVTYPSGNVRIAPDFPEQGTEATIFYDPGTNAFAAAAMVTAHVGRDGWQGVVDLVMTNDGSGIWSVRYDINNGASRINLAFTDGLGTWDDHGGRDWSFSVLSNATGQPAAVHCVLHTPSVGEGEPGGQNRPGETFDFSVSGDALVTSGDHGFGSFGRVYFNHDQQYLYIGAEGANPGAGNHAMVIFLSLDTMTHGVSNLWSISGTPFGLDSLHNLGFSVPVNVALVLGDEFGDGTFPHFNLVSGYDFGQGIFQLSSLEGMAIPLTGARLSQFDGKGSDPVASPDDDGNRLVDQWEAAIPWTAINAGFGIGSIGKVQVCGVIVSDGVSGQDRYISGNYLGNNAIGSIEANGNHGFHFVSLTPWAIGLPGSDSDHDGIQDLDELIAGTDAADSSSYLAIDSMDMSTNGSVVMFGAAPGKRYFLQIRGDGPEIGWQEIPVAIVATNSNGKFVTPAPVGQAIEYRLRVSGP